MFTTFKKKSQIEYVKSDLQIGDSLGKHKSMVNKIFQNKYVNQETHLSQDPRPKSKTENYLMDDIPFKPKFVAQSEEFNISDLRQDQMGSSNKEYDNYTSIYKHNMNASHFIENEKILDESTNKLSPKQSGVFVRKKKVNRYQIEETKNNESRISNGLEGKGN
jgi:hypothetical protein